MRIALLGYIVRRTCLLSSSEWTVVRWAASQSYPTGEIAAPTGSPGMQLEAE